MYSSSPLCDIVTATSQLKLLGYPFSVGSRLPFGDVALPAYRVGLWCARVSSFIRKVCARVSFSVGSKEDGRTMGLTISNLFARLFSKKQMRILMGELREA